MENRKEILDTTAIVFFIVWILLRGLSFFYITGLPVILHFFKMIVIFSSVFLVTDYLIYSQKYSDEHDNLNKFKAFKLSWGVIILAAIIFYAFSKKTSAISLDIALEVIIWLGYLSYLISYKIFDNEYFSDLNVKFKKLLLVISLSLVFAALGCIMGLTTGNMELSFTQDLIMKGIALIFAFLFLIYGRRIAKKYR